MNIMNKITSAFLGLTTITGLPAQSTQHPNIIYVFPDQFRNSVMQFWIENGFSQQVRFKADPVITPHLN